MPDMVEDGFVVRKKVVVRELGVCRWCLSYEGICRMRDIWSQLLGMWSYDRFLYAVGGGDCPGEQSSYPGNKKCPGEQCSCLGKGQLAREKHSCPANNTAVLKTIQLSWKQCSCPENNAVVLKTIQLSWKQYSCPENNTVVLKTMQLAWKQCSWPENTTRGRFSPEPTRWSYSWG